MLNDLTVRELKTAKTQMEESIQEFVQQEINKFSNKTKINVCDIYIDIKQVSRMGISDCTFTYSYNCSIVSNVRSIVSCRI